LLLAGGLVAAPLAAWLVKRMAPRKLGVIVGAAILLTNARTLASTFGVNGAWRTAMYLAIVAVVGAVAAWRLTQVPPAPPGQGHRRHRPAGSRAGRRLTVQVRPTGRLTPVPSGEPSRRRAYPRKAGWMTAASARSNAFR
jgi:hypothetical protein